MRINKFLAQGGIGSRRKVEELIVNGMVTINGETVKNLATNVEVGDIVLVNGEKVVVSDDFVYYVINKPKGYLSSTTDQNNMTSILKLINFEKRRIYPVGRLDFNTEGLLILTNDGDFANRVISPKNEIEKEYVVVFKGQPSSFQINSLQKSMLIDGYKIKPAKVFNVKKVENVDINLKSSNYSLNIIIHEGRNRQIRKMFDIVGLKIVSLKRIRVGNLQLGNLKIGQTRKLSKDEIESIFIN